MTEMKYAIAAMAITGALGWYLAYDRVRSSMCADPAFITINAPALYAKCSTLSTYDIIQYYERLGTYSTIPK